MTVTAAGYFPVLHAGCVKFLDECGATELIILDEEFMGRFDWFRKEIRALAPPMVAAAIAAAVPALKSVRVGGLQELRAAAVVSRLIMPDDEVTWAACSAAGICELVELRTVFLRWNSGKLTKPKAVASALPVSRADLPHPLGLVLAEAESAKSSDWWRHVGAAAVRDGQVQALAHNRHVPTEYQPYFLGDPRMFAKKGVAVEVSTALHAEAGIISAAARQGLPLDGSDLYVTTFSCPPCAKLIAAAGFRRLYFVDGYGMLDAETVLTAAGVEIFRIID